MSNNLEPGWLKRQTDGIDIDVREHNRRFDETERNYCASKVGGVKQIIFDALCPSIDSQTAHMLVGHVCSRIAPYITPDIDDINKQLEWYATELERLRQRAVYERSIDTAPTDGTPILLWVEHENLKYCKPEERNRWEGWVVGSWVFTEENQCGWSWHGHCGKPTGWANLPTTQIESQKP